MNEGLYPNPAAKPGPEPGDAKAWVIFSGIAPVKVLASYNIAGVVRNGAGDYTVSFLRGFPNGNYVSVANSQGRVADGFGRVCVPHHLDTGLGNQRRFYCYEPTVGVIDSPAISITFFGELA